MPRLAKQFTVIAIDLRGVGGSAVAPDGYDAAKMAGDVYQLALTLELQVFTSLVTTSAEW